MPHTRPPHRDPMLKSDRLILRGFRAPDVSTLESLIEDPIIAQEAPHWTRPYPGESVEKWIERCVEEAKLGARASFAVFQAQGSRLVGHVGLRIEPRHARAELSCWIGKPYRGHGMATEACRSVVQYGFETLVLDRIFAFYPVDQAGTGRLWKKLGLRQEGTLKKHFKREEERVDVHTLGLMRDEFWVLKFTDPKVTQTKP